MSQINSHYDVVIIGAGPAGMTAAITLSQQDVTVAVFDEQALPGGQIYRNVQNADTVLGDVLSKEPLTRNTVKHGADVVQRFLNCGAHYFPQTLVWNVEKGLSIAIRRGERVHQLTCNFLLIATGAQERPVPFKGWQLPGVMGVGAAQILLKSAAAVPDEPPVLFGTGPLFYLYAAQLIVAGVVPAAILDTANAKQSWRCLQHLPNAVTIPRYLLNGLGLLRQIRKSGAAYYKGVDSLIAHGENRLERIEFTAARITHTLDTSVLLSHHGVIPETRLLQTAGVECQWDDSGQCWKPVTNQWGESTVEGVYSIGDGAGISGAYSAEYGAAVACFDILCRTGVLTSNARDEKAKSFIDVNQRDKRIRPFLESKYRLPDAFIQPSADTIVCRCESVTAQQITDAVDQGCYGPNQVKSFTRCGMGACQGRMCGPTVEAIIADKTNRSRDDVGRFRARSPVRPVSLVAIAALHSDI